ncbi:bacteriophage antitermination protein Q [Enterobacter roggenkampii]|uniref:bacteriophage antitermination protein Q n=1 Tax=Enterobacter roggenkampii TaxID=1812935 RepID=UPI000B544364|nr:bacteriophage antitermination protein Q [Enterobacter roggenkampii]ASG38003.1 antitermination protein [Enterobacter roggenkampii]MDK4549053.1 bacteriophage antitermination protein Q [Enterobacter roggenkampii]MDX7036473.1 bacteriophage antitermination protein Q [Enterobacter roggenkampii]
MNAQQLEYVRIQLRAALVDDSGGTKGQLEAFAEHPPANKNKNPRQQVHVVELDNGRGGVRRVKAENSALYVLETRRRSSSTSLIRERAFQNCKWRRTVSKLSKAQQSWVRYCYGYDLDYDYQKNICESIWFIYLSQQKEVKIQSRVKRKLLALTWLAIQERARVVGGKTYNLSNRVLSERLDIARQTWFEIYALRWAELQKIVSDFDELTLEELLRIA